MQISIILYINKVSSGLFISIHTYIVSSVFADKDEPDQTGAQSDLGLSLSTCARRHVFAWRGPSKIVIMCMCVC